MHKMTYMMMLTPQLGCISNNNYYSAVGFHQSKCFNRIPRMHTEEPSCLLVNMEYRLQNQKVQ